MSAAIISDAFAHEILVQINRSSSSLIGGMDALLLKYLWRKAGHADAELAQGLQLLVQESLVEVLPGVDMALRLSPAGFERVQAALLDQGPASADGAPEEKDWAAQTESTPSAAAAQARSEFELRQRIMDIFADLNIPPGGRVASASMSKIWADSRIRAEELRHGIDLLERDGYMHVERIDGDGYFVLSQAGFDYAQGRSAPSCLVALAPPAHASDVRVRTLADLDLMRLVMHELAVSARPNPEEYSVEDIEAAVQRFQLPGFLIFHAADLLHRRGLANLVSESPLRFRYTGEGRQFVDESGDDEVQRRVHDALKVADHVASH